MSKITESNLTNLKVNSNLIVYLLEGFAWNKDLTESDLDSLKEVLSDLKETIQDVEFALFVAPNDKEFIEANKELSNIHSEVSLYPNNFDLKGKDDFINIK